MFYQTLFSINTAVLCCILPLSLLFWSLLVATLCSSRHLMLCLSLCLFLYLSLFSLSVSVCLSLSLSPSLYLPTVPSLFLSLFKNYFISISFLSSSFLSFLDIFLLFNRLYLFVFMSRIVSIYLSV